MTRQIEYSVDELQAAIAAKGQPQWPFDRPWTAGHRPARATPDPGFTTMRGVLNATMVRPDAQTRRRETCLAAPRSMTAIGGVSPRVDDGQSESRCRRGAGVHPERIARQRPARDRSAPAMPWAAAGERNLCSRTPSAPASSRRTCWPIFPARAITACGGISVPRAMPDWFWPSDAPRARMLPAASRPGPNPTA